MKNWQGKHGPFLIAEIGGNHEGSFEYAVRLTELACDSGVDAIKFQIYTGDTLVSSLEDPDRNKHFKNFELKKDQYIELANICNRNDVLFTSSVWDTNSIDWIDPYMPFYKIGSGDLTAYPLLKHIALKSKPIVLSTGLSNLSEVKDSIEFIRKVNPIYESKDKLAILQCTSMYPIPDEDAFLSVIEVYKNELNVTAGYSDHTVGNYAVELAYAIGAEVIEMHFTDNRSNKEFRDHKVSFTKKEIKELIQRIKKITLLKGRRDKLPLKSEEESNHTYSFRRAVYPSVNLNAGDKLTEDNLTTLRPNKGIDARDFFNLIGRKITVDVKKHQSLSWDMIEDS
tara:strand:+ start:25400 stop:26419 length:1020 start_codon:yes stop_codon:yes gene_type:complete